ncbi:MAG: DUF4288 domain-containing protein [Flavobacteriales bacterium]
MNWYISKLVFRIRQSGEGRAQFDEQWRLINAVGINDAIEKAELIGAAESEVITRSDGASVGWEFVAITDLFPFTPNQHGNEVYSRIEQPDNEHLYLRSVEEKAKRYNSAKASA